jgi:hypothetical protein
MSYGHVISVQADMGAAPVKPRSGDRSQNYMAPEAADALKKAEAAKADEAAAAGAPAVSPATK